MKQIQASDYVFPEAFMLMLYRLAVCRGVAMTIRYKADPTVQREVTELEAVPIIPLKRWVGEVNDYYFSDRWEPVPEKQWVRCNAWKRENGDLCISKDGCEPITKLSLPANMRFTFVDQGTVRFEREEE